MNVKCEKCSVVFEDNAIALVCVPASSVLLRVFFAAFFVILSLYAGKCCL